MSLNFIAILEKGKASYINMHYVQGITFENLKTQRFVSDDDQKMIDATRVEIQGDNVEYFIVVPRDEANILQFAMQTGGDLREGITLLVLSDQQPKLVG